METMEEKIYDYIEFRLSLIHGDKDYYRNIDREGQGRYGRYEGRAFFEIQKDYAAIVQGLLMLQGLQIITTQRFVTWRDYVEGDRDLHIQKWREEGVID